LVFTHQLNLGRSQLDEAIRKGIFPVGIPIIEGGRALGWFEDEIHRYVENRRKARDQQLANGPKVSPQPPQLREAQERNPARKRRSRQ
jgi:predicted DNA-binding transcriptional regulator AlpA